MMLITDDLIKLFQCSESKISKTQQETLQHITHLICTILILDLVMHHEIHLY